MSRTDRNPPNAPHVFNLTKQARQVLKRHFGADLSEDLYQSIEYILNSHNNPGRRKALEDITPSKIVSRLNDLDRAITEFIRPFPALDLLTLDVIMPPLAALHRAIQERVMSLRDAPKFPGVAPRSLSMTARSLGAIFRNYSPHTDRDGRKVPAGTFAPLPKDRASKSTIKACREFVCAALNAAAIPHDDYKKNPSRIDRLIWTD